MSVSGSSCLGSQLAAASRFPELNRMTFASWVDVVSQVVVEKLRKIRVDVVFFFNEEIFRYLIS